MTRFIFVLPVVSVFLMANQPLPAIAEVGSQQAKHHNDVTEMKGRSSRSGKATKARSSKSSKAKRVSKRSSKSKAHVTVHVHTPVTVRTTPRSPQQLVQQPSARPVAASAGAGAVASRGTAPASCPPESRPYGTVFFGGINQTACRDNGNRCSISTTHQMIDCAFVKPF